MYQEPMTFLLEEGKSPIPSHERREENARDGTVYPSFLSCCSSWPLPQRHRFTALTTCPCPFPQSGSFLQHYNVPRKKKPQRACLQGTQRPLTVVHRQMHLYLEPCQTAGQLTSLLLVCEGKTSPCGFGSAPENTPRSCTDLRQEGLFTSLCIALLVSITF